MTGDIFEFIIYGWMTLMSLFILGLCIVVWTLDKDNEELSEALENMSKRPDENVTKTAENH